MKIDTFELERLQSLWENEVQINLTESGIHPFTLRELLSEDQVDQLLDIRLSYGWTNGEPGLRDAVAAYYQHTGREEVLITNGSSEANFLAVWTLVEPGDEIAFLTPNYMQIAGVAKSIGAKVKTVPLILEDRWRPDLKLLRKSVNPQTKLIVLCNPNNPTGAVFTRLEMEEIIAVARENGARIYADEVYRGAELNGEEGPSFRDLDEQAIVASGLSKALAHPGLRIGWLAGPADFISQAWKRNDYTTITTCRISEYVAEQILKPHKRAAILERNRGILKTNLGLLEAWVKQRADLFDFVPPQAGGVAFLRYQMPVNSTALTNWLREEKSLLVLPGDVFGMDRHLRLGIGEETDYLAEGLDLLAQGLRELETRSWRI